MTTRQDDFVLSGFADEIDDSLDVQLDVLDELGIEHIDLRSVDGTNILDLSDEAVAETRRKLDDHGIEVAALGTPIGKIGVTDPFGPERERIEHALDLAERFDADYLRVFSYYIPEGDDPADHREEVLRRVETATTIAEEAGVTLGHENEKRIYGDTPARCRDLLTTIDSPRFRAVFDPANFLEIGVTPYPDALLQVAEFVEHLHVKDAIHGEEGEIHSAGEGDARFPDLVSALAARGFDGYAALEPHLFHAGEKSGFSGPEGFERATTAFRSVLDEADVRETTAFDRPPDRQ